MCELCLVMQCVNSIAVLAIFYSVPQCQRCMLRSKLWYESDHTARYITFSKKADILEDLHCHFFLTSIRYEKTKGDVHASFLQFFACDKEII